jgi:hypothetical protein
MIGNPDGGCNKGIIVFLQAEQSLHAKAISVPANGRCSRVPIVDWRRMVFFGSTDFGGCFRR